MTARDFRLQCRIYGDTVGYVENKQLQVATIEKAMDTYARQEAVGFAEWLQDRFVRIGEKWAVIGESVTPYTTEQLYDLYQQQKQKR